MKKLIIAVLLFISAIVFIHILSYGILAIAGWLTNDFSFAMYVYQEVKPAITLIGFCFGIFTVIHFIIEYILTTKNKKSC